MESILAEYDGIIFKNKRLFFYIHLMLYAAMYKRKRTEIDIVKNSIKMKNTER